MPGGSVVDNIMDKLAEKITAQEMIKANSQAEVETAINDATQALFGKVEEKLDKQHEENQAKTHDIGVQTYRNVQAILNKQQEKTEETFKEMNVKLEVLQTAIESKNNAVTPLLIVTLIVALADLVLAILRIFGIL